MNVRDILKSKGDAVESVAPDTRVADALATMDTKRIGAVVVSGDSRAVDGILSERDVVRALARKGPSALDGPVSAIMTAEVVCCSAADSVQWLMERMTEGRFRHLPVVVDGALAGMISIGDVVKARLAEIEAEAESLRDYIAHG
ncbi:MAG: CBS domain-containing protein [Azospirillaceae bacterium]